MNKNQFFNLKRFTNYSRNLLLINAKSILISVVVLFVIMFLLQYISMPKGESSSVYKIDNYEIFFFFYVLGLGVFIGSGFKPFNQKVDTRNYLAVPVSTFEKYLTEFLFRIVIGTIGLFVIYWLAANLARHAAILTLTSSMDHYKQIVPFSYKAFFENTPVWELTLFIAFIYITLFNFRLFFNKHGFIKSLLTVSTLFFIIFILVFYIGNNLILDIVKHANTSVNYDSLDIYPYLILWIGIVGFSIFGYFKLKEKEL